MNKIKGPPHAATLAFLTELRELLVKHQAELSAVTESGYVAEGGEPGSVIAIHIGNEMVDDEFSTFSPSDLGFQIERYQSYIHAAASVDRRFRPDNA